MSETLRQNEVWFEEMKQTKQPYMVGVGKLESGAR